MAISTNGSPASRRASASRRRCGVSFDFLPIRTPRAFASGPSPVLARISSRSNSTRPASRQHQTSMLVVIESRLRTCGPSFSAKRKRAAFPAWRPKCAENLCALPKTARSHSGAQILSWSSSLRGRWSTSRSVAESLKRIAARRCLPPAVTNRRETPVRTFQAGRRAIIPQGARQQHFGRQ